MAILPENLIRVFSSMPETAKDFRDNHHVLQFFRKKEATSPRK
jgi:hypothetical protein